MGQTPPVEKLFSAGLVKDPVMGYALGRIGGFRRFHMFCPEIDLFQPIKKTLARSLSGRLIPPSMIPLQLR